MNRIKNMFGEHRKNIIMYVVMTTLMICAFIIVPRDGAEVDVVNSDASYHTLSMIKNFQDYSFSEHLFIPTVTMKHGLPTEWGPCIEGNDGKYYYCSFMPLDVVVPYLFLEITGLSLTISHLHILSLILGILSAVSMI